MTSESHSTAISGDIRARIMAELEKILASEPFRNSKQAERMLRYLVAHSLEEDEEGLRERAIGERVFGRPPKYDSNADSIVRVWANHLRKRLAQYYQGEGSGSSLRFAIPPGSYRVEFRVETVTPAAPAPASEPPAEIRDTPKPVRPVALPLVLAVAAVLALACGWLALENSRLRRQLREHTPQPPLSLLWSRMFNGKQATQIVLADSNLSLFQDLVGKTVSLQDYVRHNDLILSADASDRRAFTLLMARRYTSMADVDLVRRTLLLQDPESARSEIVFARDFAADDLKRRNVVLVGSKRSNPWVQPFEDQLNFRFDYDAQGGGRILNTHPKPGEPAGFTNAGPRESASESYGLLAFQPNLAHNGNALIIAGLGMEGTLAAGEFATNADLFKQVVNLLGNPTELPYFEVVLKAEMVGSSVHGFKLVAWRAQ